MDFNSIKVRLKQFGKHTKRQHLQFQFHKGTIKTASILDAYKLYLNFNSIKVRLKPYCNEYASQLDDNFNSIKVRLKLFAHNIIVALDKFQFHKGTIKTSDEEKKNIQDAYFNSIKVRLKLYCSTK